VGAVKRYTPSERTMRILQLDLSAIKRGNRESALRLLLAMSHHADTQTLTLFVEMKTLADESCVSISTIKRVMPMLEQTGMVMVNHKRKGGNMYLLMIGDLDDERMRQVVEVFNAGGNNLEVEEKIRLTIMSLNNRNNKAHKNRNKAHHSEPLTGERYINWVNTKGTPVFQNNKKQSAKPSFSASEMLVPQWLNPAIWAEYVTHRKQLGKPLTEIAAGRLIGKLEKLQQEGHDPTEVIEQSLDNGWVGVFELRRKGNGNKSQADRTAENIANMLRRTSGDQGADEAGGEIPRLRVVTDDW
jgi:DNA-binding IscR family transcriptional regulator